MCRPCPQGGNTLPLRSWRRRSPKRPCLMNRDRAAGSIFVVGRDHPHPLYDSHAAVNASKYGVLSIQEWSGLQCDEELAAIRVRARVCHRYDSGSGVLQIPCYFIGKFATIDTFSTSPGSSGIPSLNNKFPYSEIIWHTICMVFGISQQREGEGLSWVHSHNTVCARFDAPNSHKKYYKQRMTQLATHVARPTYTLWKMMPS